MNRKKITLLFPILCLLMFVLPQFLAAQTIDPEYKNMLDSLYVKRAPHMLVCELANFKNAYLLDAREEEEFEVSHLKNARNVGYIWFDMRKVYNIPHDAPVVVYCTAGWRSEKIAEKLHKAGYTDVYNLYGGIFEWINEGYPVYRTDGTQTSEIHTYNSTWAQWVNRGTKVN